MKIQNLLGMLLLGLIPIGAVVSCDAMRTATPEERTELESLDAQLESAREAANASEAAITEKLKAVKSLALKSAMAGTPEEAEQLMADLQAMTRELEGDYAAWEVQLETLHALGSRATEIEGEIGNRQTGSAAGMLGAIDPRLGALAIAFGPLVARIGSRRSREHLADAAKKALKLALGDSLASLVKAYGFTHTDETSAGLTLRADAAASREARP